MSKVEMFYDLSMASVDLLIHIFCTSDLEFQNQGDRSMTGLP